MASSLRRRAIITSILYERLVFGGDYMPVDSHSSLSARNLSISIIIKICQIYNNSISPPDSYFILC